METAIYWVQHVAKNKGAPYLRSAAVDLPFYKYYNWDVYGFIGIIWYLMVVAMKTIVVRLCCKRNTVRIKSKHD